MRFLLYRVIRFPVVLFLKNFRIPEKDRIYTAEKRILLLQLTRKRILLMKIYFHSRRQEIYSGLKILFFKRRDFSCILLLALYICIFQEILHSQTRPYSHDIATRRETLNQINIYYCSDWPEKEHS